MSLLHEERKIWIFDKIWKLKKLNIKIKIRTEYTRKLKS